MVTRDRKDGEKLEALDRMIVEIAGDVDSDDEQLRAFRQAFEDNVAMPVRGYVIGEPVLVVAVDYDGNQRRGLTARCRRAGGAEYAVALCDVVFLQASEGARYVAAYRRWLNIEPYLAEPQKSARTGRQLKATETEDDIDLSKPVEVAVLAVKEKSARCRLLGSDRVITLRAGSLWELVPGAIATVIPRKQWRYAGHPYLSGEIQATRIDVKALNLEPLALRDMGMWDPEEEYWGEEEDPAEEWAKPIIAHGPRPMFEMEQVLPGADPNDPFEDPIIRANDLRGAGNRREAIKILMELCQADLRCLDAHSHLGHFVFDHFPQEAIRHYEVGLRIGELSLGDAFNGVLSWSLIDNRPFLRCMHGYGLCLWRLGRFNEAERVFERMLWLNPSDNQGVRFLIDDVKARRRWEDRENE